jgi:molybdopterin synthase sulfur carrier subunit
MASIKLFATLRDIAGAKVLEVSFENVSIARDLTGQICRVSPPLCDQLLTEEGELTGQVHILVNGRNIMWLQGLDTPISEADNVVLIPPVAGG